MKDVYAKLADRISGIEKDQHKLANDVSALEKDQQKLKDYASELWKEKQKLADRSLIADAINNFYEFLIMEYKGWSILFSFTPEHILLMNYEYFPLIILL